MSKYRSPYGCKTRQTAGYPTYPSGKPHGGEDWVPENKNNESNWKLYAIEDGEVYISKKQTGIYTGGYGAYGNYIVYKFKSGYWALCAHMKNVPSVKAGAKIKKGDLIGYAGSTGNSSGRHLHIEISDMRNVKYTGSTWYAEFVKHRVKPSSFIDFEDTGTKIEPDGGFDMKVWKNGSTKEYVYQTVSDCKAQGKLGKHIGYVSPREACECYGIIDGMYLITYNVSGASTKKCGFVKYSGGVK